MATNDYYHQTSYYPSNAYHDRNDYDRYDDRREAPLPPLPTNSPFHDRAYPDSHGTPTHFYTSSGGQSRNDVDSDPFEDEHAIPMSGRRAKHNSSATIAPILPDHISDRFVRDVDPNSVKKQRHISGEDPWFNGRRTTWVVYVLTIIQLIVFLAQFIRNGILTGTPIELHPSFNHMIGPSPYLLSKE